MTLEIDRIYCGDCLDLMREMPDKSVDLVLTDPPYGIGEAAGKNKTRGGPAFGNPTKIVPARDYGFCEWDNMRLDGGFLSEMGRVSKNQIVFGGNYYADLLDPSSCWLVWDKDNSGDFADCELAWTSFKTAVRKFKWRWNGMLQEDMRHKEERIHPTQKPVPLFIQILEKYSKPGDLVLDPFLGSGTTAIACLRTGRHFIGIEKHEPYFIKAQERIDKERAQVRLFDTLGGGVRMTPPTASGPRVLYISGPFSHPDPVHGILKNILLASEAALLAWRDGWAVHCPHKNCAGFEHAAGIPYETWIQGDLELLRRADAICMVGSWAKSPGALREYRLARALGMPIYRYVAEEIRLMPATMLPVYDALAEEVSTGAAD